MYIIAGLGNPTKEYEGTRHNIGFRVIDELAKKNQIAVNGKKHKAIFGKGTIEGEKVILAKPQTYMNLSGESIREMEAYYKVPKANIVIIYDDISLDVGQLRIRPKGSAGGHNGIKSIISHLGTTEFPRVRIGVGDKPSKMDLSDYVLSRFSNEEAKCMEEAVQDAVTAVELLLECGVEQAMNKFNGKQR